MDAVEIKDTQFLMTVPAGAAAGMVKLISTETHWPGANAEVLVIVTIPADRVAVIPELTAPIDTPVNPTGIVSFPENEVSDVVPLLQIYIRYLEAHPGWPVV